MSETEIIRVGRRQAGKILLKYEQYTLPETLNDKELLERLIAYGAFNEVFPGMFEHNFVIYDDVENITK